MTGNSGGCSSSTVSKRKCIINRCRKGSLKDTKALQHAVDIVYHNRDGIQV